MNFLKLSLIFTFFISHSVFAQFYDGRHAIVKVGDTSHEYEIRQNIDGISTLYKDGYDTEELHAEKVFNYKTGDDEHLVVWFKKASDSFWGHSSGIYIYKPWNMLNKWDHLEFFDGMDKHLGIESTVIDMVKQDGRILILRTIKSKSLFTGKIKRVGYIQYLKGNLINPNGALSSRKLDFTPERFLQDIDGKLYILGFDEENKVFKEYLFVGVDKDPKYLSTISE